MKVMHIENSPNLIKQIDPLKANGGERVQMSILTELLNDVV